MNDKQAENVRVIVRCRPMNHKEHERGCTNIIDIQDCTVNIINPSDLSAPSKMFTYDNAYASNASSEVIYNDICYSLIENVLEGYNATIFAYGQTGCGKSYTMQGPENVPSKTILSSQRGIIPRSFDHIFEAISVESGVRYLALVSYLEIYNENIRDLLNPNSNYSQYQLKEIPGEGVVVQGLSTHTVHNARECEELLELGQKYRMVGATLMNVASSRSHSIFTISLEQIETKSQHHNHNNHNNNQNPNNSNNNNSIENNVGDLVSAVITQNTASSIKKGKLNLVDLAGSERQNKTGASGDRLKEATKINLSLSALGNVISALVDGKTKHIPYRDSKLTRLLQDSLGGNTKTLMIACISPADYNYDETLSTLRYASRAKNISNKPRINEDPKEAILREYQKEIQQLRKLLMETTQEKTTLSSLSMIGTTAAELSTTLLPRTAATFSDFDHNSWLEVEKQKLKKQYEDETQHLKNEHEEHKKEKEELVKDMERLKIHYENQLKELAQKSIINNNSSSTTNNNNTSLISLDTKNGTAITSSKSLNSSVNASITTTLNTGQAPPVIQQQEALNRIEMIKNALIGGERANDIKLKEKRYKRKIAAQRRLSALAHALSRVEQSSDRDLLQEHYTDIQHELKAKNELLKSYRQKIRALEREVTDLQSEFQFDRADYLETIRRLERNLKFYQQLLEKALPILRKDGKYWDPDLIQNESIWNDDLKCWKLPEDSMHRLKLPPATTKGLKSDYSDDVQQNNEIEMKSPEIYEQNIENGGSNRNIFSSSSNESIADSYFRPKRITELIHQNQEILSNPNVAKSVNTHWINLDNFHKFHLQSKQLKNNINGIRNIGVSSLNGILPLTSSWLTTSSALVRNESNSAINSQNDSTYNSNNDSNNNNSDGSSSQNSDSNNSNNTNIDNSKKNTEIVLNRTWNNGKMHALQLKGLPK